jgi:uncharacterized metal-binding protein YceD (DUF177 family)
MIALSVPLKRVHPGVKDGSLQTEALTKLNELKVKDSSYSEQAKKAKEESKQEEDIDPRWDKLKKLLTDK